MLAHALYAMPLSMLSQLFHEQPLLLLFAIVAVGYPLGQFRIGGVRLGMVSILLTGMVFGALSGGAEIPQIIYQLGLVLFVYAVGLSSGSLLRGALKGSGLPANMLTVGAIIFAAVFTLYLQSFLGLDANRATGMFAGTLTATPALAAVLDYVRHNPAFLDPNGVMSQLVVGYSLAYPFALFSLMGVVALSSKLWRIDHAAEARRAGEGLGATPLRQTTIKVTNAEVLGRSISELIVAKGWKVMFGRYRRGEECGLMTADERLRPDDLVTLIGEEDEVGRVIATLGEESSQTIHFERSEIDYQRFFVSNPKVAGARLRDLRLPRLFGAVVTRIRRGDLEFVPHGSTILQAGDRVRVVARRDHMKVIARFLGDSYRAVSEVNLLALSIGISLGLLLGVIPLPLGNGMQITLGFAGGPLVVGLALGALRRSGGIYWIIPYGAHQTVSQLGSVLFLAGIGTRAGGAFLPALADGSGLVIIAAAVLVSVVTGLALLYLTHRVLKIPYGQAIGVLAGLQTQSAILEFCTDRAGSDLPKVGYAMVYPAASLTKIVIIQLLFGVMG